MLVIRDAIPAITGARCRALIAQDFWANGQLVSNANVLFLQVADGTWHRFFIDAGVLFWKTVDAPEPPRQHGDWDYRHADIAARWGLLDKRIVDVYTADLPRGGELRLIFEGSTIVVLRDVEDHATLIVERGGDA
jgi:hypothetical protein